VPTSVADIRANLNENIRHAARSIGRSIDRRKVFEAICRGKKAIKTVEEIAKATRLTRMRVLQEGGRLVADQLVTKTRKANDTAYRKDSTLCHHKRRILSIVHTPAKAKKYPTKQEPKGTVTHSVSIRVHGAKPKLAEAMVDHIDSFRRVRAVKRVNPSLRIRTWSESRIKRGLKRIIGEPRDYKDWGGEKHDLYTTRLRLKGRRSAAFALKGKATQGVLTPKKMGANGDQIARLVASAAQVFIIVYHSTIAESVVEQLRAFALAKALGGTPVYYGVIDGEDLNRLVQAYPSLFT
jgi:hypothetical protein